VATHGDQGGRADELAAYEQRFRRAGLPLFIQGFSASTDVFNRVVPLLALVFCAEMLGAIDLDWSLAANIAAALGGLAILLVAIGIANRLRGRPFRSVPRTVGRVELTLFVLVPALLPLIFGGQFRSALVTAGANLLLLGLIYAVVGYGLLAIVRWVFARIASQLASALGLLAKAVPLLMIFALLSFTNQEMWQIFSTISTGQFWAILALFIVLGSAFLLVRIPREARAIEREAGEDQSPLERRQRLNVGLVMFVSQAVQVLIVSAAVGLFFVAFGLLAINEAVRLDWMGDAGNELVAFDLLGERVELTSELLRVAAGLAAFSGFYFAIAMLTDSTYREEFLDEVTSDMRETFRERAEYLRLCGEAAAPG
jgi:hypothetical protein